MYGNEIYYGNNLIKHVYNVPTREGELPVQNDLFQFQLESFKYFNVH